MTKRTEFLLILIEEQIRRDYYAGNVSAALADEAWHALYDLYGHLAT
jgi:hypothetical protein